MVNFNGRQYFIGKSINQGYLGQVFKGEDEWGSELSELAAKVIEPQNQTYEDV
ncbi:hypothetical protein [Trichormus azollae]|uniref:hypothetical protein n=1 Tax=Trichormus azollae TaxID=1164 RepID=UPI0002D35E10|nr:hypothetical protein [Trichormus azollae]